jgi:ABC-type amino acid transport substrate-binding protein
MPKGDTALCTAINAALESLKADGTFAKLEEQYITNYSAQ